MQITEDLEQAEGEEKHVRNTILAEPISALELGSAITVPLDATLQQAVESLQNLHIGCVLVVDKEARLAGIFTERDLLNRVAGKRLDWNQARVADYMTPDPETLRPDDKIVWALNRMHIGGYRHVPLVDPEGRPVGVVSVKDIVGFIVELFPAAVLNLPPDPHQEVGPGDSGGGAD